MTDIITCMGHVHSAQPDYVSSLISENTHTEKNWDFRKFEQFQQRVLFTNVFVSQIFLCKKGETTKTRGRLTSYSCTVLSHFLRKFIMKCFPQGFKEFCAVLVFKWSSETPGRSPAETDAPCGSVWSVFAVWKIIESMFDKYELEFVCFFIVQHARKLETVKHITLTNSYVTDSN